MYIRTRTLEPGEEIDLVEESTGLGNPVEVEEHNSTPEAREASVVQQDRETLVSDNENAYANQTVELDMLTDAEMEAQEKAATKAQAAFRGYLVRLLQYKHASVLSVCCTLFFFSPHLIVMHSVSLFFSVYFSKNIGCLEFYILASNVM